MLISFIAMKWKTLSNTDPQPDPFKANFSLQIELGKHMYKPEKLGSRTSLIINSHPCNKPQIFASPRLHLESLLLM